MCFTFNSLSTVKGLYFIRNCRVMFFTGKNFMDYIMSDLISTNSWGNWIGKLNILEQKYQHIYFFNCNLLQSNRSWFKWYVFLIFNGILVFLLNCSSNTCFLLGYDSTVFLLFYIILPFFSFCLCTFFLLHGIVLEQSFLEFKWQESKL
jgi:hypothetical protein